MVLGAAENLIRQGRQRGKVAGRRWRRGEEVLDLLGRAFASARGEDEELVDGKAHGGGLKATGAMGDGTAGGELGEGEGLGLLLFGDLGGGQ